MHRPVTKYLRQARGFSKLVTVVVLAAFTSLTLQPLALAANLPVAPKAPAKATTTATDPSAQLAQTLEALEAALEALEARLTQRQDAAPQRAEVKALEMALERLDQQAQQDFEAIEQRLKANNLPPVIFQRHQEAVQTYQTEMQTLKQNLNELESALDDDDRTLKAKKTKDHLKEKQKKRRQQPFDPNDLPNKSLQPNPANTPKLSKAQFIQAGLTDNPTVKLAAHGTFTFDKLPGTSDPAYLAATAEVTLTPAIQAKAAELGHNPVKIYNWVRNNVEWLPTWGATQDADVTLGSKRGNSLDIASLLIALYRASGIPARYVHGTIEVSVDRFMNWAGGFTSINAAADYVSSGGVPVTTITSGGKITKVQLEHLWVEAALDFYPSGGAINKSADSWIQLDPSFKQYDYLQGLDVVQITGLDPNALAQSFATSGTVNTAEGWVQNLNPAVLQTAQTQARTALTNYINTNLPNPTVGDVIGGRKIVTRTFVELPAGLPNRTVTTGAKYGTLPGALQNAMTFAFGTDILGDPINPVTFPWAKLNNHKVTLSFKPATPDDEQALFSLLPDGQITELSQLPSSIPSYLINVVPNLAINGNIVATGSAIRLGEDFRIHFYAKLANSGSIPRVYNVPAGAYLNLPVVSGYVSPSTYVDLKQRLQQTQAILESGNAAQANLLDRDAILGDIFHAGSLGYYGQYAALSHFIGLTRHGEHNLAAGFGSLGYEPNVSYFFGFPRAITTGGVVINVWLVDVIGMSDGSTKNRRDLQVNVGFLSSALEHAVPEQMSYNFVQPPEGISAVKSLKIAAQEGQRIYHITTANQAQALSNLHFDNLIMDEIIQALAVGKEVISHTDNISVPGWTGAGYILFDPQKGDGAYKIAGGVNGGGNHDFAFALSLGLATLGSALESFSKEMAETKLPMHKDLARHLLAEKIALAGKFLGGAALVSDIYFALADDSLSLSSKVGRIAVAMFGFGVASIGAAAIATAFVSPILAAIIAAFFVATLTIVLADFSVIYFSSILRGWRRYA